MILKEYNFLGEKIYCKSIITKLEFSYEFEIYSLIKRTATKAGYRYIRIDTQGQQGFPDILLLKGQKYIQIEAKFLRRKQLNSIVDDLKWQFGQIAYMKRSFMNNENYILAVAKDHMLWFFTGGNFVKSTHYTQFVKLF